ncbi:MAG: DMT family transporter [Bryobacter sp.]|nr:DMT family transporter [Bryobacter sp. CoA8 C33]
MNARVAAIASAVLFSTGGAVIKGTLLPSWHVAGLRSLIAAAAIALLMPGARRSWSWPAALIAVAYAICLTSFVLATKNTTAANAIFLQGTAPLYLVLLGPWLLQESIHLAEWVTLALVACGIALVFSDTATSQSLAPQPALGNALGALSGAAWAATVCGLRWLSKRQQGNSMAPVLIGNLLAFAFCSPQMWPWPQPSFTDTVALLYLGIFQVGLAYWCLTRAMTTLPALEASLLIMVEPALNPLWTWLLHDETPSASAIGGGALIIVSALLRSWRDHRNHVQ